MEIGACVTAFTVGGSPRTLASSVGGAYDSDETRLLRSRGYTLKVVESLGSPAGFAENKTPSIATICLGLEHRVTYLVRFEVPIEP